MFAAAVAVGEDELLGLDEHAARAAARVVDPAGVRFEDFDQDLDDAGGGVELAAALALGAGEHLQEVLVDLPEHVAGLLALVAGESGVADQVDELAEAALVDVVAVEDLRQHAGQGRVGLHDRVHRVVDQLADARALGLDRQRVPAGAFGNPEDAVAGVLVLVVEELLNAVRRHLVGEELGADLVAALGEGVGDVLEEDQAEDEVLVLGGVHGAAELVGRAPEDRVQFGCGLGARQRRLVRLFARWHYSSCPVWFVGDECQCSIDEAADGGVL